MFVVLVIGEKGNLTSSIARQRADEAAKNLTKIALDYIVELAIHGFDDDPRELWDIAEARDYFIVFCERLAARGVKQEKVLPQSMETLRACYARRAGHRVIVRGTPEDTAQEGVEQALAHWRRH